MLSKGLFIDRDGVINVDLGFVYRAEDFIFKPGIFDLVVDANRKGYKVVIVTNQSGIARGLYDEQAFFKLTSWMLKVFECRGCRIHGIYFCPFHPVHGIGPYKVDSEDRKPKPGMILKALRELAIDPARSVLIGDRLTDIEAGKRAGVRTLLYLHETGALAGHVGRNYLSVSSLSSARKHL